MDATQRIPNEQPESELTSLLASLAKTRATLEELKAEKKALVDEFENSKNYLDLKSQIAVHEEFAETFSKFVRDGALKAKTLPQGVTVKTFKEALVLDGEAAREWCFENFKPAMKIDEKILKGAIKDGLVPASIGKVVEEKRAQIASDLSSYLGG